MEDAGARVNMANDVEELRGHLQAGGLVGLGAALASVEEVLLDVIQDGEPGAARFVADGGAVGAGCPLGLHHGGWTSGSMSLAYPMVCSRSVLTLRSLESERNGDSGDELLEGHDRSTEAMEETTNVLERG